MKMKREGSGVEVEEMWSCLELGGAAVIYSIWYSAGLLCPRTWNFLFFFTVAFIVIISLLSSSSSVLGFSCLWGEEQRTIVRKNYLPHPEASVQIISCRVATVRRRSVESSRVAKKVLFFFFHWTWPQQYIIIITTTASFISNSKLGHRVYYVPNCWQFQVGERRKEEIVVQLSFYLVLTTNLHSVQSSRRDHNIIASEWVSHSVESFSDKLKEKDRIESEGRETGLMHQKRQHNGLVIALE